MLDFINKTISKVFGNKTERDLKDLTPFVLKVKDAETVISKLNDDELRAKTAEFKYKITEHTRETLAEISELNNRIDSNPQMNLNEKEDLYRNIDDLKKEENKKIEELLLEILPEAFAVVRETARRFTNNTEIVVNATQHDRDLSVKKNYIRIHKDCSQSNAY